MNANSNAHPAHLRHEPKRGQAMHNPLVRSPLLAAVMLALIIPTANAATFSTANHPLTSFLSFDFYIGNPMADPGLQPLGTIGPIELNGSAELDVVLDGLGDGSIEYVDADLEPDDISGTFDLGTLGTVDFALQNIHMKWTTAAIDVNANDYMTIFNDDTTLIFDAGTIVLENATGPLADLVGTGILYEHDYGVNSHTAYWGDTDQGFFGYVDNGPGGLLDAAEADLFVPGVIFPGLNVPGLDDFYLGWNAEVHIAVPEPGTFALAAIGLGCLAIFSRKRASTHSA